MSGTISDIVQLNEDISTLLGDTTSNDYLSVILDKKHVVVLELMTRLETFSLGSSEATNSAFGLSANVIGAVGAGSFGSAFKVKYADGIEQIVKRIDTFVDSEGKTNWKKFAVFGEALIQIYLSRLNPNQICHCQGLRRDPSNTNVFYITMAPLNKNLNQHVRESFDSMSATNIDQFVLDIIIPIFRLLQSLSPRAGQGHMDFHGDLHTGNIMYREGGFPHEPVLIDFGRARCTLSNGTVIGPFDRGFNVDMLTVCASLNQILMNEFVRRHTKVSEKKLVVSPLLTNILRFAYPLLTAEGTFNWHNLFFYNPRMEMVEHFLNQFLDHVNEMRVVEGMHPTIIRDPPPPTTYVSADPLAFVRMGVPAVVIPIESSERTPPSSAAAYPTTSGLSSSSAAVYPNLKLPEEEEKLISSYMASNNRKNRSSRKERRKERHKERHKERRNRRKTRRNRNKERN